MGSSGEPQAAIFEMQDAFFWPFDYGRESAPSSAQGEGDKQKFVLLEDLRLWEKKVFEAVEGGEEGFFCQF